VISSIALATFRRKIGVLGKDIGELLQK